MKNFIYFLAIITIANAASYDYYVFAVEWAGSVCKTKDCTSQYTQGLNPRFFNIHGLWPSTIDEESPSYCGGTSFNPSLISQETTESMVADWSGLYSSAYSFHKHEWEKHGTCWNDANQNSGNVINDFFTTVIQLAKNLDVYGQLTNHGIAPSGSESYSYNQIQSAIQNAYGYRAQIQCSNSGSNSLFTGIYLCLDLSYNPRDCPSSFIVDYNSCNSNLMFPMLDLSIDLSSLFLSQLTKIMSIHSTYFFFVINYQCST